MKPPKFHVGQAVVCIKARTRTSEGHEHVPDVLENRLLHVAGMEWLGPWGRPYWYLWFDEIPYPSAYLEDGFAPAELASDEAIAELLEEAFTPVHA